MDDSPVPNEVPQPVVVVYSGTWDAANQFLERLIACGLQARILETPDPFLHWLIPQTYRFQVAVVVDQAGRAAEERAMWEDDSRQRVDLAVTTIRRQVPAALLVTGLSLLALVWWKGIGWHLWLGGAVFVIVLSLIGQFQSGSKTRQS